MNKCGNCILLHVKNKTQPSCADIGITETSDICKNFDASDKRIIQLQNLTSQLNIDYKTVEDKRWDWLDKFNASQAFLICIGAGPWKIQRRTLIQKQALYALGSNDLSQVNNVDIFMYPLKWQNQKTLSVITYLKRNYLTMKKFVTELSENANPAQKLYEITETKNRAKVLDLFVRDYIKAPAFPIDRWVAKLLKENDFPQNENYMIELCKKSGLNPRYVARLFVSYGGFSGNPDITI